MLKISFSDDCPAGTIYLEGKLMAPWVDEVRATVSRATSQGPIRLDLAGLTFADQFGVELLHQLTATGAAIEGASPFISELLTSTIRQVR